MKKKPGNAGPMKPLEQAGGPPKLLLSVDEAAGHAGVGRGTAYALVKSGEWRTVKIGRVLKVPATEPAVWVARTAKAEAE